MKDTAGRRPGEGEKWEKHGCVASATSLQSPHAGCPSLALSLAARLAGGGAAHGPQRCSPSAPKAARYQPPRRRCADRAAGGGDVWGLTDVRQRGYPDVPAEHRTDLTVYTEAGAAFFDGRPPYEVSNPRGWTYLYPPLLAMLLAPLHRWRAGPGDRLVLPESLVLLGLLAGVPPHRGDRLPVGPDRGRRLGPLAALARHGGGAAALLAHAQLFAARAGGSRQAVPLLLGFGCSRRRGLPFVRGEALRTNGDVALRPAWWSWTAGRVA